MCVFHSLIHLVGTFKNERRFAGLPCGSQEITAWITIGGNLFPKKNIGRYVRKS